MRLILDSGGLSRLAERTLAAVALQRALKEQGLWPPVVPSIVLVERLTGDNARDARTQRLLKACDVAVGVSESLARRAASLRYRARRGSAVDALVVASAEPSGVVLTGDTGDLGALAAWASGVTVEGI